MGVITRKTVVITDELMRSERASVDGAVLLHSSCREGRMSHNKAYRSADGRWYVRKGKRGQCVRYLTECVITYHDGELMIHEFKTDYLDSARHA